MPRFASTVRPALLSLAVLLALAACRADTGTASSIAAVQGASDRSPVEGRAANIEGVVTLVMADGAFVQSLVPDADPATSEGLFLMPASGQPALRPGQHIHAEGRVAESGDGAVLTTLADAAITVLGEASLPEPVLLSAAPADWESLEGMRVRIDAELTVVGNHALGRFGEITLAFGGRTFVPTEQVMPGEAARTRLAENRARMIVLDDASLAQNPAALPWLPQPLSEAPSLRSGSVLSGLEAIVDERFGGYRLQAIAPPARIEIAPRPEAPQVAGSVRVVGMNLLNLFNGDGQGGGFPTERGAKRYEAYARQLAKHVEVITALDPAIIAAQELENDGFGPESAIQELADALNSAQPGARWVPVASEGRPGSDSITVGMLYRADRVAAVGRPALATEGPFEQGSRPVLAQSFRAGRGPVFTVMSVHFKSKGGCDAAQGADRDQNDGQACFNAKRVESAEALHAWAATDPTASGSDHFVVIGDFNAYGMEDPMRLLRERGWVDAFEGSGAHSFVYDAQSGRLDHALLSASLATSLRGAAKWHVNADEPLLFAYDGALGEAPGPWRSSDHDPMLLGFDLDGVAAPTSPGGSR